jgi:hypothetical protein
MKKDWGIGFSKVKVIKTDKPGIGSTLKVIKEDKPGNGSKSQRRHATIREVGA